MRKKEAIIIIGIIVIILVVMFCINKNKTHKNSEKNISQNSVRTEYNNEEEKYVVYDETGKEIYNGTNRAEAEFRERHPDFNPGFEEENMILTEIYENGI